MSTKITLTYCGMEGTGETVKLAKQDAARKIEAILAENTTPYLVTVNAHAAVVWFEPKAGWVYRCVSDGDGALRGGDLYGGGYGRGDTRDEVITAAIKHVADLSWSHDVADDRAFFSAVKGLDNRAVNDLVDRAAWQRRYRTAANAGTSDADAHRIACENRPA